MEIRTESMNSCRHTEAWAVSMTSNSTMTLTDCGLVRDKSLDERNVSSMPSRSVGLTWMTRTGMLEPERAPLNVDEVPDPSSAGDFVLPLLHRDAAVIAARQPSLQPMMAGTRDRPICS
nr:hypothetical protein [Mycobacterium avium]